MPISYKKVNTYRMSYICDKCGTYMKYDSADESFPPQFTHVCPKCKFRIKLIFRVGDIHISKLYQ